MTELEQVVLIYFVQLPINNFITTISTVMRLRIFVAAFVLSVVGFMVNLKEFSVPFTLSSNISRWITLNVASVWTRHNINQHDRIYFNRTGSTLKCTKLDSNYREIPVLSQHSKIQYFHKMSKCPYLNQNNTILIIKLFCHFNNKRLETNKTDNI